MKIGTYKMSTEKPERRMVRIKFTDEERKSAFRTIEESRKRRNTRKFAKRPGSKIAGSNIPIEDDLDLDLALKRMNDYADANPIRVSNNTEHADLECGLLAGKPKSKV